MHRFPRLVFVLLCAAPLCCAQTACPPTQAPAPNPSKLLFTPKQEMELGEVIRQQFESEIPVIEDEMVTGYLNEVGQRVAKHLPASGLRFRFLLYDRPEVQAFGMPGGRIYVSRKMVAFLKNEDELAGVLGHEMGHLAARQQALALSQEFRDVLGLKSVSDSDDLFDLYNQFVERFRIKNSLLQTSPDSGRNQMIADQLGVQAVARAGYAPQAYPNFLDRLLQTKGKTGNWFPDLFGATRPDSRRLREALKDVSSLPAACIEASAPGHSQMFQQWQAAVLHYRGIGHPQQLSGVLSEKKLNNPLRGDIENFRFSPSGKYLLAQDEGGIYVLTRDPLKFIFRIDAADAGEAQFSPDSNQVVFFSPSLQVETWDIRQQEQAGVTDVPALHGCRQTSLSPDAKFLACLDDSLALTLYDVATGDAIFHKEHFFDLDPGLSGYDGFFKLIYLLLHPQVAALRFSPDGRYFAASSPTGEIAVMDLVSRQKINLPGVFHSLMKYSFTFVGPNRLIGVDESNLRDSPLVEFPSGKVLERVPLGSGNVLAATDPTYILVRPVRDYPVGVFDLDQKKFVTANRMPATDVWAGGIVSERVNGEIGLYNIGETSTKNVTQLPIGSLGSLRAFAASPDLKFLAISARTRGAIWDLEANQRRFHLQGFQNAYYDGKAVFFLDFPKFEKTEREIVVASPVSGQSKERPVEKDDDLTFLGSVLLRTKHGGKNRFARENLELQALDIVDLRPLWSRNYPKQAPWVFGSASSGQIVLSWNANAHGLQEEVAREPKLQALLSNEKLRDGDYLLELVGARDGTVSGGAVIRTGKFSFSPVRVQAVGGTIVVEDNRNRVLVYSSSTGEERARWFGSNPQISADGRRLCLANGRGQLIVYDLQSMKQIDDLFFGNPVSAHLFSADGHELLVLTNDQTVFTLNVSAGAPGAGASRISGSHLIH